MKIRIGNGFDVHKLNHNENANLVLGGVEFFVGYEFVAHSDGDVVLHAIVDSILGALAKGDIGEHFSPNNPNFKNKNSEYFIEYTRSLLKEEGMSIINIDINVICQAFQIGKKKQEMRKNIANILNLDETCVGVKAKTVEKLGALGRNEGVAATVSCLLGDCNIF